MYWTNTPTPTRGTYVDNFRLTGPTVAPTNLYDPYREVADPYVKVVVWTNTHWPPPLEPEDLTELKKAMRRRPRAPLELRASLSPEPPRAFMLAPKLPRPARAWSASIAAYRGRSGQRRSPKLDTHPIG